jgi:pSer/pThr/pTyr-binding forkhead associated (FHA) protein
MARSDERESITGEHPVLVALQGPLEGKRWFLKEDLLLGRDPGCNLMIEDRQVSRQHARLTSQKAEFLLEDLGSKNGTYRNGDLVIEPVMLADGDIIQIALIQKFAYYSSDATMPISDLDPALLPKKGKLILDKKSRRVWVGKKELIPPLSAAQFRLLYCLYEQTGKVITREELIEAIWQGEDVMGISDQALDAMIRRTRGRLAELDNARPFIITIRGHGVRLEI